MDFRHMPVLGNLEIYIFGQLDLLRCSNLVYRIVLY